MAEEVTGQTSVQVVTDTSAIDEKPKRPRLTKKQRIDIRLSQNSEALAMLDSAMFTRHEKGQKEALDEFQTRANVLLDSRLEIMKDLADLG